MCSIGDRCYIFGGVTQDSNNKKVLSNDL